MVQIHEHTHTHTHKDLKEKIAWVVSESFKKDARRFIHIDVRNERACWSKNRGKENQLVWNKDELISTTYMLFVGILFSSKILEFPWGLIMHPS